MRVAAYVHVRRSRLDLNPTGVGKHINEVVPGLARTSGIDLEVLGAREDMQAGGFLPATSPLVGLPVKSFGWKRRYMEASWTFLNWPSVERWTGPVDWVYCPAEAYVATRRAKLAVTVHCDNWFESELPWYNDPDISKQRRSLAPRYRRLATNAQLVLPVSHFLAGRLTALFGIPPERMRVVGNGVEEAYFQADTAQPRLATGDDRPYVVVVGSLTRRKGAPCVLATARALLARNSSVKVFVAGQDDDGFNAEAAQIANIKFLGYVGVDSGLPALLRSSVALLFPSRYETFGIPAVEAMAAGTPAIVSHFAGLPEVVGNAGVIVDPNQPEAIADTIVNLARDSALRQKYVEAGRQRAEQFRWSACVDRVANALREFS